MSSGSESFITAAVLRQQVVLYVLCRVGARLWLVLSPLGWADTPALRLLAAAFAGYDVVLAVAIRRGTAPPLWARLLLDIGDVALWAWLCPADRPYTAAVLVAMPTVTTTTIVRGVRAGLVASVALAVPVATVRLLAGEQPFVPDVLLYSGLATVLGAIVARLLPAEARRQQEAAERLGQADLVAAELAGGNDVVTGVGADAIDDLQSSIMRLTAAEVDAAAALRATVARHKQELAERTRADAVYLRDLLDGYSASVRAHEPAVARHVFFDVPGEDGACVLSRRQARQLTLGLGSAGLTGVVDVRVVQNQPRRPVIVDAGGHRFVLETTAPPVHLPVAPIATVGLALYIGTLSNPYYTAEPWRLTVPLAALVVVYAAAGLALVRRYGQRVEPWLSVGTLAPFAVVVLLTAHAETHLRPARVTLLGPLAGLALLFGTVIRPRPAVAAAWLSLGLATAAVIATAGDVSGRFLAAELIWPTIAFLGAFLVSRAVARLSGELSSKLTDERLTRAAQARQSAARRELAYLVDVLSTGEELCAAAREGPVRSQVRNELGRLRRVLHARLADLG